MASSQWFAAALLPTALLPAGAVRTPAVGFVAPASTCTTPPLRSLEGPRHSRSKRLRSTMIPPDLQDMYIEELERRYSSSADEPIVTDLCSSSSDGMSGTPSVVMMRHGESAFNRHNVFTGWCDVPLTEEGEQEATAAGELLAAKGLKFDVAFCSVLQRSTVSCHRALAACDQSWIDVRARWELNERHYGDLQGLNKQQTAELIGPSVVDDWRQGYHSRPPPMRPDHPHMPFIVGDRRYQALVESGKMPTTESIADTAVRVMDLWKREIVPLVEQGKRVLIVSHRNSLRALIRNLEGLSDDQVSAMDIPTGVPFVYPLDQGLMQSASMLSDDSDTKKHGFQARFLCEDAQSKTFRHKKKVCQLSWAEDPSCPPPECYDMMTEEDDRLAGGTEPTLP